MAILFHDEKIISGLKRKRAIKSWILSVIEAEKKSAGSINIILTNDSYLLEINRIYLSRDYYTDIISFDYSEGNNISGDLFISLERIKENSKSFKQEEETELLRVIIHGILHLIGYSDSDENKKRKMRIMEDKYLNSFPYYG